jgi:transcriptional regulator with PAS, ATPase and Fis domain
LFRLNTVEITLPPLRERKSDIEVIALHYIQLYSRKYEKKVKELSSDALVAINNYHWPGNVRALRHAIERAIILSEDEQLQDTDFQLDNHPNQAGDVVNQSALIPMTEESDQVLDLNLDRLEKQAIEQALKQHRYNISHSAIELGLTRAALYRRMEKHGL